MRSILKNLGHPLSREEMKKIFGGISETTLPHQWSCHDPGQTQTFLMCSNGDPTVRCGYGGCVDTGVTCTHATNCV